MNATERAYQAEILDPNTPTETLRLWHHVESEAERLADRSMRKAQGLKDNARKRLRMIKNALKKRGENV